MTRCTLVFFGSMIGVGSNRRHMFESRKRIGANSAAVARSKASIDANRVALSHQVHRLCTAETSILKS